ncbi:hypothetical protein [Bosea sp. NPDC055594]|jgi:hypothetical protein
MSRIAERIAKLELSSAATQLARRVVRHVLDCDPADRPARLAAIEEADPKAFHIVRVIVRRSEVRAAA